MTHTSQPLPIGRYGSPTLARRRAAMIAVCLLGVAGIGLVGWLGVTSARTPVRWNDVGFDVQGPEEVMVTFDVAMAPGSTAVCTVDALAPNYAQVGTVEVNVGPVSTRSSQYVVHIATAELATTGTVVTCRPT